MRKKIANALGAVSAFCDKQWQDDMDDADLFSGIAKTMFAPLDVDRGSKRQRLQSVAKQLVKRLTDCYVRLEVYLMVNALAQNS